mmetsp:Transcript_9245/g.21611  ORF Transcript_9245/g.21611 Transcript_9245/m.21611 type:complete len:211 (-) Transcript_9245:6-638(-)
MYTPEPVRHPLPALQTPARAGALPVRPAALEGGQLLRGQHARPHERLSRRGGARVLHPRCLLPQHGRRARAPGRGRQGPAGLLQVGGGGWAGAGARPPHHPGVCGARRRGPGQPGEEEAGKGARRQARQEARCGGGEDGQDVRVRHEAPGGGEGWEDPEELVDDCRVVVVQRAERGPFCDVAAHSARERRQSHPAPRKQDLVFVHKILSP